MRTFGKALVGTALALSMVSGGAASARPWGHGGGWGGGYYPRYHRHYHDGFGNFLLGAGLVGAIAVIASSGSHDGDREIHTVRDDPPPPPAPGDFPFDRGDDRDYPPSGDNYPARDNRPIASNDRDAAVAACKVAAEREGERYSSRVHVGAIDDVRSQREGGYRVTGIADIDKGGPNARPGDIEHARFDCTSAGGRVVAFRFGSSSELAQRY